MTPEEKIRQLRNEAEILRLRNELARNAALLEEETRERKRMELEVLEITQKAQNWFGSQLHDGLCQDLAGILMFAEMLTQKFENENAIEVGELRKISGMLHDSVNRARETARGSYVEDLNAESLTQSLRDLTSRTAGVSGARCLFVSPEDVRIDDKNAATHLYRIAQEGILNALHHGKARHIEVELGRNEKCVELSVKDDGVGLPHDTQDFHGIGLKIIQYRCRIMGADFRIDPNRPHGVILTCRLDHAA